MGLEKDLIFFFLCVGEDHKEEEEEMEENNIWGSMGKERGRQEKDGRRRRGGLGRPWPAVLEACWVRL